MFQNENVLHVYSERAVPTENKLIYNPYSIHQTTAMAKAFSERTFQEYPLDTRWRPSTYTNALRVHCVSSKVTQTHGHLLSRGQGIHWINNRQVIHGNKGSGRGSIETVISFLCDKTIRGSVLIIHLLIKRDKHGGIFPPYCKLTTCMYFLT